MSERTRLWIGENTTTAVQFRTDVEPRVHLHTNMGWIPIAPEDDLEPERQAEAIAVGYELTEADEALARYMAGWDEEDLT